MNPLDEGEEKEEEEEEVNSGHEKDETGAITVNYALELVSAINSLHELQKCGAISEKEFKRAKRRILSANTTSHTFNRLSPASTFGKQHRRSKHGCDSFASRSSKGNTMTGGVKKQTKVSSGRHDGKSHKGEGNNDAVGDCSATTATTSSSSSSDNNNSSSSTSSSSSSSSSSAPIDFMIAPRAKVWHTPDEGSDTETASVSGRFFSTSTCGVAVGEKEQQSRLPYISSCEMFSFQTPTARPYGTFQKPWGVVGVCGTRSGKKLTKPPLRSSHEVRVEYFNCLGARGDKFADVKLKEDELRPPCLLRKFHGGCAVFSGVETPQSEIDVTTSASVDDGKRRNYATMSSVSANSNLEVSLNWYWIDMVGRDASCLRYNSTLRYLTKKFGLSESFLIDRDHLLVLPQISISPEVPSQFLICLRVATPQIALDDDSVPEVTNRWIIIVDLNQKFVITIHRVDAASMAYMRHYWKSLMQGNDISFQEFLFKLLVDAVSTYKSSLDVHADLVDLCESKLFVMGTSEIHNKSYEEKEEQRNFVSNERIMSYFAGSSNSPFLQQLLSKNKKPMDKGVINTFLYHLHRRTNVQYRILSITQTVLAESFTKLLICSKHHANQMSAQCIELIDHALELRDEAKTLLHMHISLQSFRTNELMAVLTRFSVFFTPCSFLATVYGMNFAHMPELNMPYGYVYYWIVCLGTCAFIYMYMKGRGLLQ